jgi:PAS fold
MSHPASLAAHPDSRFPPLAVEPNIEDALCTLLFDETPLGVGVVEWLGDDIRYLAVNPATAARLGRPSQEIRGRRSRELGVPADAASQWAMLAAEAAGRGGPARADWEVRTAHGPRSFRTTVMPLPTPAGRPQRFAYLTEELTQVRALEQRLGGPDGPKSLTADVEQPLAHALHVLDVAGDEVETLAACYPELELSDAADALRDGIRNTRRAHQKLRDLLQG